MVRAIATLGALLLVLAVGRAAADAPAPTDAGSDEASARALLESWLAAQNGGAFAAYQALYAQTFTGVRRSKQRTVELDRAGWMLDRQRMFARPMTVSVRGVQILGGPEPRIQFIQTWASGTYKDTGRKQLTLAREAGALRIAREEMLDSVGGEPPALDAAQLEILTALYPRGAPANLLAMTVKERQRTPGERVALLVLGTRGDGDVEDQPEEVEVAVVRGAAASLAVVARGRWEETPPDETSGMPGEVTYSARLRLDPEPFDLAEGEPAILIAVDMVRHENGPSDGEVTRTQTLVCRRLGAEVRRVLSLRTLEDTGDAECGSGERSTLSPAGTQTEGVADLLEERVVHTSRYDGRGNCNDRRKTTTRLYVWKGKGYRRGSR